MGEDARCLVAGATPDIDQCWESVPGSDMIAEKQQLHGAVSCGEWEEMVGRD